MKRVIVLIFLSVVFLEMNAQSEVIFVKSNFHDALKMAQVQKKMLFVDVYTSWCGPCRWLSDEIFKTPEAATYFNKHFVCFKIDAEKGEGVDFVKKYDVNAYPTLLMFTADGVLPHKVVGAFSLSLLIPRIECGLHKKTSWSYFMTKYKNGNLTKKEIFQAILLFENANMDKDVRILADTLFSLLSDRGKIAPKYWHIYSILSYDDLFSERFHFLLANRKEVARQGHDSVSIDVICPILSDYLYSVTTGLEIRKELQARSITDGILWIRKLLSESDLSNKAFYEAWCDVADACNKQDTAAVKMTIEKMLVFPESKLRSPGFLYTFEKFLPEDIVTLERLKKAWN